MSGLTIHSFIHTIIEGAKQCCISRVWTDTLHCLDRSNNEPSHAADSESIRNNDYDYPCALAKQVLLAKCAKLFTKWSEVRNSLHGQPGKVE